MELKDAILTTKGQLKGSTESSVQNSCSKAQNSADLTDITMGILSIFSNAIINQISMNYDVAEIKIHYNLTGKKAEITLNNQNVGYGGWEWTVAVHRQPVHVLKNCIIFIKMLIPFSKDSIIISNTPEFTRTIKHRNTMEQYLWSQAWIVRYHF